MVCTTLTVVAAPLLPAITITAVEPGIETSHTLDTGTILPCSTDMSVVGGKNLAFRVTWTNANIPLLGANFSIMVSWKKNGVADSYTEIVTVTPAETEEWLNTAKPYAIANYTDFAAVPTAQAMIQGTIRQKQVLRWKI